MFKSKFYLLSFLFLLLNKNFLSAGLLPDNIIYLGKNRCCPIKKLAIGDLVVSTCSSRNVLNNISGIKVNKNTANSAILLTLESKEKILSSLMVGADQRFCAQIDPNNDDLRWIGAESLEENMLLLGNNNAKLKIRDIQNVMLENSTDLYEISLNPNNTFYLVDSNGNLILTHNFGWLILLKGILIAAGIGGIIGGGIGAGIVIYKSYAKEEKISASTVVKGVIVGAATGAAVAAVTYAGVYVALEYFPIFLSKLSTFLGGSEKAALALKTFASNNLVKAVFIGTTIKEDGISYAKTTCNLIDENVEKFVLEAEKREKAAINFSGIHIDEKADKDFLNQSYQGMSGKTEFLKTSCPFLNPDGKPFKDSNGNNINFVFATYSAAS